jgi:hypothetical protein
LKKIVEKCGELTTVVSGTGLILLFAVRAPDECLAYIVVTTLGRMDARDIGRSRVRESKTVRSPFGQQHDKEHRAENSAHGLP